MNQTLESILTRTIDQQKFAEAKNAALATLSSTAGFALIATTATRRPSLFSEHSGFALAAALLFVCAAAIALWSFLPRLRKANKARGADAPASRNFYFFGDLAAFKEEQLLREIAAAMGHADAKPTRLEHDLANQVIVNAQITLAKLRSFRLACVLLLIGLMNILALLAYEALNRVVQ